MFYGYHIQNLIRGRVTARVVVAALIISNLVAGCRKNEPAAEATVTLALTPSVPLPAALSDSQGKPFDQAHGKVDVGGYEMYLKCTGSGAPAVILEAGYDKAAETWPLAQAEAACSCDGACDVVCEGECLNTTRPNW